MTWFNLPTGSQEKGKWLDGLGPVHLLTFYSPGRLNHVILLP
jgi:hypothetical protein